MQISVKVPVGKDLILTVDPSDDVGAITKKVRDERRLSDNTQLYYQGRILKVGNSLGDYEITDQAMLVAIGTVLGGFE
jgi:hypothetical protein